MQCGYEYWNISQNWEAAYYRANGWSLCPIPKVQIGICHDVIFLWLVISHQRLKKLCLVVISKDYRLQIFAYMGGFYASYRILKLLVSSPYLRLHQSGEEMACRGLSQYLTNVTQRLALAFANRLYPQELYINSTLYINITIGSLIIHAFWFVTTTDRHIPPHFSNVLQIAWCTCVHLCVFMQCLIWSVYSPLPL